MISPLFSPFFAINILEKILFCNNQKHIPFSILSRYPFDLTSTPIISKASFSRDLKQIKSNPIQRIFKALNKHFESFTGVKSFKINVFAEKLAKELVETLDRVYLQDLKIDLKNQKRFI